MVADHFERIEGSFGSSTTFFALGGGGVTKRHVFFFFFLVLSWLGAGDCSQSTEPMRAWETRQARRAGEEDEPNSSLPCVVHFVVTDMTDTWESCLSHALAQKQNVLHSHEEQGRKHEAGGGAHHDALSLPPKHGVGAGSSAGR